MKYFSNFKPRKKMDQEQTLKKACSWPNFSFEQNVDFLKLQIQQQNIKL